MSRVKRSALPALIVLLVMLMARAAYFHSDAIGSRELYHIAALASGLVYFLCAAFSAALIYPISFFKGAPPCERIIASSVCPAAWVAVEIYNESAAFTAAESLYFGLMIGSVLMVWSFTLMGACELLCRLVSRRRGERTRVVTPAPLVPFAIFALMICLLSIDRGAYFFNLFLKGYVLIFR